MTQAAAALTGLGVALREAALKVHAAYQELERREDEASSWVQRFIYREIGARSETRGAGYWDELFPGLTPEQRADARVRRMLGRATVAGIAAAAGASAAEVMSVIGEGAAAVGVVPLGLLSVGAEILYTTALEIDLAFDLASIYDVPFARDDIGEISTLLALAFGVALVQEPTRHDKPAAPGEMKLRRVMRQMLREDFAERVAHGIVRQAVLRNVVPVAGVVVSAVWNQVVLRRFADEVHAIIRERHAIRRACRALSLGESQQARIILDGAWLMATADGDAGHHESLALATLIDSLSLPERIAAQEASFCDDEEEWMDRIGELEPAAQGILISVLSIVAGADGALNTPERRMLRRVARRLGRPVDLLAIERAMTELRRGDVPLTARAVPSAMGLGAHVVPS